MRKFLAHVFFKLKAYELYFLAGGGVDVGEWSEHGGDGVLVFCHEVGDAVEDVRHVASEPTPVTATGLGGGGKGKGRKNREHMCREWMGYQARKIVTRVYKLKLGCTYLSTKKHLLLFFFFFFFYFFSNYLSFILVECHLNLNAKKARLNVVLLTRPFT